MSSAEQLELDRDDAAAIAAALSVNAAMLIRRMAEAPQWTRSFGLLGGLARELELKGLARRVKAPRSHVRNQMVLTALGQAVYRVIAAEERRAFAGTQRQPAGFFRGA